MAVEQPSDEIQFLIENGVISELNRLYLHPRGLAMQVDSALGAIWIARTDDGEGYYYPSLRLDLVADQSAAFDDLLLPDREGLLGFVVQPLDVEGS